MTLFTLATTVVLYQLARERYFSHHIFSVISLHAASMVFYHSSHSGICADGSSV